MVAQPNDREAMTTSSQFRSLEINDDGDLCDTHATSVAYNIGFHRRGDCQMPATIIAQLQYVPAMPGQRLLKKSYTTSTELLFVLTEDDIVIRYAGFVSWMATAERPCHIRMTQPGEIEWKRS